MSWQKKVWGIMRIKLSKQDRCAIDLVLEHRAAGGGNLEQCFDKSGRALQRRVDAVEKVFDVLSLCEAEEPQVGLAASTMKFIEQNAHTGVGVHAESAGERRRPYVIAHAPGQRSLH